MSRSAPWRATLIAALPLAFAATAHAQRPTAKVVSRVDVNGNSKLDEVRIDEDGSITVHISGDDAAGAWTPLAASGKVVGGSIQISRSLDSSRTIILATSELGRRGRRSFTETVALAWSPGKLETLWRGKLGAQGPDGGSRLSVELGKFGLIKYSSRAGVSRCDGEAAHLDAERYDFTTGRFRPARQARRMSAAQSRPALVASRVVPQFVPQGATPFWFRATGASSAGRAASAAELVPPVALTDGDDKTAWTENKGGVGAGEFVTLRSGVGEVQVKALRLFLGHGAARTQFNRPKRLGLILSPTEKFWIEIPTDPKAAQWVTLPVPVTSKCVTLVLDTVYPKRALAQTAISEISIFSEEELDPTRSAALLASRIAEGAAKADTNRLLARLGASAGPALLSAISQTQRSERPGKAMEVVNLRLALASIPAEAAELVAGLTDDSLRPGHHSAFSDALRTLGAASVGPLGQAMAGQTLSAAASQRVARTLAKLPQQEAAQALLGALGTGAQHTRTAVVRAIAGRRDASTHLSSALATGGSSAVRADLLRAMGLAGERLALGSAERETLAAAVADAAQSAKGSYEEHYRFLQAAGQLGGPGCATALLHDAVDLASRQDAEGLALLRRAMRSLGTLAATNLGAPYDSDITDALRAGLGHSDTGVRLAVLSSLQTGTAPPNAIEDRLRDDTWPEVRRAAAGALSGRCDAASARALREATLADTNTKVARSAFSGLLGCGDDGSFDLALKLVDEDERPLELRLQAARALGELAGPSGSKAVLLRFARARKAALSNRKSGKVASALSRALGDLGTPEAIRALERSAADPAFPQLQAASITALGGLCPASSTQLLRRLRGSREGSVAAAATRAVRQCSAR